MLRDLGLPEDLIADVQSMLADYASDLESNNVDPIDASVFGASTAGATLGFHSDRARQHVAKAVLQMAAGLRGYRDSLEGFREDVTETDHTNASAFRSLQTHVDTKQVLNTVADSAACVAAPDFTDNEACTLPTEEVDD